MRRIQGNVLDPYAKWVGILRRIWGLLYIITAGAGVFGLPPRGAAGRGAVGSLYLTYRTVLPETRYTAGAGLPGLGNWFSLFPAHPQYTALLHPILHKRKNVP